MYSKHCSYPVLARYSRRERRREKNRIPVERLDVLGSSEGFSQHVRHRHGAMGQVTGLNREGNVNSHPTKIVNSDSKIKKPSQFDTLPLVIYSSYLHKTENKKAKI